MLACAAAAPLAAQAWDAPEALALRAAAARRRADDAPLAWRARAHGLVTWQVQPGDGAAADAGRLVTADESWVEVYGREAGRSKQTIVRWRRGRFLPAEQDYHRDHLAIVTDGWPDRISIGGDGGDEVRNVLHPLAPGAEAAYEFAIGDSLEVAAPDGAVKVLVLLVRPRSADSAAVAGTIALEAGSAALVRFQGTFTPAAYRDGRLRAITFDLQQSRVAPGVWLPWRQRLEILREERRFDLPVRYSIRTSWQVGSVELLDRPAPDAPPAGAPAIGGLQRPAADSGWPGPLTDLVRDQRLADGRDLAAARARIAALARERLRPGGAPVRVFASRYSDFLRVNRVQGLTPGFGLTLRPAPGWTIRPDAGFGTSDSRLVGGLQLGRSWTGAALQAYAERRVRDLLDWPVVSGPYNSLATLIDGADAGDYYRIDRAGVRGLAGEGAFRVSLDLALERVRSAVTSFGPLAGSARPNPALGAGSLRVARAALAWRPPPSAGRSAGVELGAEAASGDARYVRLSGGAFLRSAAGPGVLELAGRGGAGSGALPPWRSFALGGRGTLVGEPFRAFGGSRFAWARAAWLLPVPVPELRLKGPLTTGPTAAVGPFVAAGWTGGDPGLPGAVVSGGIRPVAGVAIEPFWGLVRLELGTPLRGDGAGRFSLVLDVHPDWWPLL